ncbi:MAG: RES family NAD+ phosphorylase [Bacteroidales bacterium]|nr:RES family NAD+ phosphorylase [Bacteroidales bacterium]
MEVCSNCFADKELKGFILSSTNIGNCNVCDSSNVALIDITELLDFFQELIGNFRTTDKGESLKLKIQKNWNFFASQSLAAKILDYLLPKLSTDISSSDDIVDYNEDIIDNFSHWEVLKNDLKWTRRFLSDIGYLEDLGWDGFFNTQYELKPSDELFRARVHHQSGILAYKADEMMSPPSHLVGGGRANPLGIPYLYLSDNSQTVLYEVRATYLDELSIGTFYLKDKYVSVKIVDFTEDTPLFQPTKINETIKARILRDRISSDLSKPMRRYDSEIEYIPTQFICEFINVFTGASGIRFSSSVHPRGKNVVIFDQNMMVCKEVILKKVNRLNLNAIEIK